MSRTTAPDIAADLREQIRAGRYGPGVQLPSATALQARYGVARGTAGAAVELLKREGLVTSKRGAGWFVTERAEPEEVRRSRLDPSGQAAGHVIERVTTRPATHEDADRLHTALGAPIFEIHRTAVAPDGTMTSQASVLLTGADHELVYELPAEG